MKIRIRKKVIIAFSVFLIGGGSIWFLNYYKSYLLNQKLQILEKKDSLFNTILEARRYEKNYFLFQEPGNLEEAISYVRQGEQKLSRIIEDSGRFTLARNLEERLDDLRKYERALAALIERYNETGSLKVSADLAQTFSEEQEAARTLGRRITVDMEAMIAQERHYVYQLIKETRIYHFMALLGMVLLSILAAIFLLFNVNRPLKAIEDAIHKIAEGDYESIPAISVADEFESLVTSLNNMIYELNRRSEQLIQSEKMASLGALTSGVAHELNNPLNNISTSVQILLEELGDPDLEYKKELLTESEKQVERARDIVKALLEFSRERSFSLKPVRLKDLVNGTIRLMRGEMPASVELAVDVPDEIQGNMDPRRIQQVLINLISNGVQAMEGGGILNIRAYEREGEEGFFLDVEDNGKGIPEEVLPRIFDPFFTTKDVGKGSGLGLSVSHGIIEQHGGRIEVDSEVGKGTTFTVFLPTR
ncbi:sensor histidine kinase [Thermodesulfobacteriota bacterium]